jgi:hypothetical protein
MVFWGMIPSTVLLWAQVISNIYDEPAASIITPTFITTTIIITINLIIGGR